MPAGGSGETTSVGATHVQGGQTAAEMLSRIAALERRIEELERPVNVDVEPMSRIMGLLRDTGNEIYEIQRASDWTGSLFARINQLKPDHAGKVGELFVTRLCRMLGLECVYNEDINDQDDGTYDTVVNGKRVEIKTARLGKQGGFQHESLRTEGCDYYMFLDIVSTHFYITVCKKFDMSCKHPVFGRKPHLRKGASDVYKFDFGEAALSKGISAGITLKITNETSSETVANFMTQHIV